MRGVSSFLVLGMVLLAGCASPHATSVGNSPSGGIDPITLSAEQQSSASQTDAGNAAQAAIDQANSQAATDQATAAAAEQNAEAQAAATQTEMNNMPIPNN